MSTTIVGPDGKSRCPDNRMHVDNKKRRSFLALFFSTGDAKH